MIPVQCTQMLTRDSKADFLLILLFSRWNGSLIKWFDTVGGGFGFKKVCRYRWLSASVLCIRTWLIPDPTFLQEFWSRLPDFPKRVLDPDPTGLSQKVPHSTVNIYAYTGIIPMTFKSGSLSVFQHCCLLIQTSQRFFLAAVGDEFARVFFFTKYPNTYDQNYVWFVKKKHFSGSCRRRRTATTWLLATRSIVGS
jgi:hypothetical protein